jgi:endothelin-converting enzyme/putative endopeptidase
MVTLKKHKTLFEKKINIPDVNNKINPGDNFYMYINDKWLQSTNIPNYETSYSINEEIEEIIEDDLISIINYCTHNKSRNKLENTIGIFNKSCVNKNVQKNSLITLNNNLKNINCMRSINDIGSILGSFCRNNITTLLSFYVQLESTKENKYIYTLNIEPNTLGLPDVTYYKAKAPGKIKTLMAYIEMIKKICILLNIDDISDIIILESFYSAYIDKVKDDESILINGEELLKKFPRFPFETLFISYGIENWKQHSYRIWSTRFIKILEKSFNDENIEEFKKIFKLHMILHALQVLPSPYNSIYYEFYEKRLAGQKKQISQQELSLELIKTYLTTPLSILYKKKHLKNSLKINGRIFIEKIRKSALDQIMSNTWLQNKTKHIAQEKVKKMILNIGWPEDNPSFYLPKLNTKNLLENIYLLSAALTQEDIKLISTYSIPGKTWKEPTFVVNAYYYNETNEFIIPAGSLFYPFYKNQEVGWNYGGLGSVIGHEMVHAFDTDGKKYNEKGFYKNWWSPRDNRRYNIISKRLTKLYNKSNIYGTHIDGKETLNENLADLGGLSIALEALKENIKNYDTKQQLYEFQQFFISYTVSWRSKSEKTQMLQSLITDNHSPAEFRVNNIICHFDEWYTAFDIKKEDKMYILPDKRIRVF